MAEPFIHNTSPLALVAAFTEVLRERFSHPNELPWEWTGNPNTSSVFIYSQYDQESETANLVPKIVVRRGPYAGQRITIGDEDASQPARLTRGLKSFLQFAQCSMSVQCIAETNGEADYIADLAQAAILCAEELIARNFAMRQISPLLVQPVQPYDTDKEKWSTEIDFRVDLERRWYTLPNALPLKSYSLVQKVQTHINSILLRIIEGSES